MKKLKLFLAAAAAMLGVQTSFAQQEPVDGTAYYLYNVETGKFLTRGATWGTQAVTNDFGQPWQVSIADGKYTLRMYDLVAAESTSGLGSNGYADNGSPIAFTPTGNATDGYKLVNGTNYLCSPDTYGNNVLYTDADYNTTWQFLNVTEYKAILAAKTAAQESAIATTAGVDITSTTLAAVIGNTDNWIAKDVTSLVAAATPSNSTWTRTGVANRGGNANDGDYGIERYQGGGTESYTVTGLTEGIYKVGVKAMFRSASNAACSTVGDAGYVNSSAYFSANGNLVQIKDWYSSRTDASNPNSTGAFVTIANNGGYYSEVYTYVGSDGTLELKAVSESYWGASWFLFNGVTLTYYTDQVTDEEADALIASIPTDKMSDAASAAIASAKTTFEANKSIANYNALNAAITAAAPSIAEYAIIDAGTVPTNAVAGWAISTTNGALACNTWSTEGNSDGSGMTTPFIQDWVGSGTPLAGGNAGGKLYYTFSNLNPGETYVVTALIRAFNESATGVTGASFFAGDNSKSLADFGAACTGDYATKGMFAKLSCAGTTDANGQLQFGIALDSDSPVNWIAIKNVTIAEGTGDVPTAIALNENSLSLSTGFTANLTATITPATADDKTVTWSSSNTAVATVAGGYVVAVGPGTATITATAYAGTNVTATCTVTVADASAPSFYSSTIADGTDYYIMNAATGLFLGGANSWGTQASLIEHGIPFTAGVGEGVYTLDSHTYNSEAQHFFSGTYVDGGSTNLYITALSDGKFSISTADGSAFATATAGATTVANTASDANNALAQWYFISKNDRDKMLAAATAQNPVDATYYVKQANISRNLSAGAYNVNAWSQYNVGGTQDNSNFAAQVYNAAVDNYQTIENIPNGTYTVSVQAFTSGTDVKFYANDQKVDVKANDSGVASCSGAAALFKQGLYPNTVTVTVTDRTLKIGFEGDCSSNKWLCYDDVTLYMTGYTANTGITATIDENEIEAGSTATITAATVPATASFNAITYSSSDDAIATVDENGIVTGVGVGTATITVAATEMESFSTTINVTVKATAPTAFALSETAIALDETTTSATLTITPTPAAANTSATWASSDETVATVVDGVVTAVSSGTATITATSTVDPTVSASATVTVTFPETAVVASTYVNNGATRTVCTLGDNLIKNGAFEYPDNYYGWTNGAGGKLAAANFDIVTDGDNKYLKAKTSAGAGDANSISTGWPIEAGKTYVFGYKIKANNTGNSQFHVVSLTNTIGTESQKVSDDATPITTEWTNVEYKFTNTDYAYVQFRARWLASNQSYDDFYLQEVTSETTEGNVQYALDAIPTANIGTDAFQYSQDAIDAAYALVQGEATVEEVQAAYDALQVLNAPASDAAFNIVMGELTWTNNNNATMLSTKGKAVTYYAGGRSDGGGYTSQFDKEPNTNLAQAFYFTPAEGLNKYKVYQIDADGNQRYLCTGVVYGGNANQVRTTTDANSAEVYTITATATEGVYNFTNASNINLGAQDAGLYGTTRNNNLLIVPTTKPSIAINTTAAGWGTTILPFAVAEIPEGVKVYSCAEANGATLTLVEVEALEANKPYIIEGAWEATLTGDAQGTALSYTEGLLTGTYVAMDAEALNGKYIMQKQGEKVGFFQVNKENAKPSLRANRAYMTAPSTGEVKAFYLDGGEDAIQSVFDGLVNGDAYDLGGRKVTRLQKGGVYIVNGKKVVVK